MLQIYQMDDKLFAECKAKPGAKVTIHYQIEREHVLSEEKTEPMKERYQGIYNKDFVLFYRGKAHGVFCHRAGNSREITEKQILTVDKSGFTGRSKYQMLNAMLQMK